MFKTADAVSILTTPTINKVRSNVSHFRVDVDSTPTSILKVKQLMKEAPAVVEGDKMLDVSLSLDNTPTMMRSRDTTPNKSLRFKEPRKVKVDLVNEEEKVAKDDLARLCSKAEQDALFWRLKFEQDGIGNVQLSIYFMTVLYTRWRYTILHNGSCLFTFLLLYYKRHLAEISRLN